MNETFSFVPVILWEHLAPEVICKWFEVSLDMPNKIAARVWVPQKGRNTSKKQDMIYLFDCFKFTSRRIFWHLA